jgi:hypothetical protein
MFDQATTQGDVSAKHHLRTVQRRSLAREAERQAVSEAATLIREYGQIGGDRDIAPGLTAELKPQTLLQHMIVNQTAAAYTLAMRLSGRANSWARRAEEDFRLGNTDQAQMQNMEAARLASSAGKLMLAVSSSALALEKLRHGDKAEYHGQTFDGDSRRPSGCGRRGSQIAIVAISKLAGC